MMPNDDRDAEFFDNLILQGAMEFHGVDEDGEILYAFTDKIKDVSPEIHQELMAGIYDSVRILWEKGFLDVSDFDENPTISMTEKAFDEEALNNLEPYYKYLIQLIKKHTKID